MKYATVSGMLVLCSLLAECGHHSDITVIGGEGGAVNVNMGLGNGQVTLHAQDAPDAVITANGDLQINQQPVTVDAADRELLKSYYENAMMIRTDGIATGKAGVAVGAQALKSVATRLASGNPDQIQQDVDAKAKLVKEAALKICHDLGNIKTSQDQLAAQLPAFKPYGSVISADSVNDCEKDQKD
jgi:hypothetical protein